MTNIIELVSVASESRISTAGLAARLGVAHKATIQLVRRYREDFSEFGRVPFEMAPFETGGGKQDRQVALLNEDQCYLLLTYSRNTARVRSLKVELVRAFGNARREGISRSLTAWQELQRLEIENASSLTRASIGSRLMLERKRALPHLRNRRERLEAQVIVPLFPQQA